MQLTGAALAAARTAHAKADLIKQLVQLSGIAMSAFDFDGQGDNVLTILGAFAGRQEIIEILSITDNIGQSFAPPIIIVEAAHGVDTAANP